MRVWLGWGGWGVGLGERGECVVSACVVGWGGGCAWGEAASVPVRERLVMPRSLSVGGREACGRGREGSWEGSPTAPLCARARRRSGRRRGAARAGRPGGGAGRAAAGRSELAGSLALALGPAGRSRAGGRGGLVCLRGTRQGQGERLLTRAGRARDRRPLASPPRTHWGMGVRGAVRVSSHTREARVRKERSRRHGRPAVPRLTRPRHAALQLPPRHLRHQRPGRLCCRIDNKGREQ